VTRKTSIDRERENEKEKGARAAFIAAIILPVIFLFLLFFSQGYTWAGAMKTVTTPDGGTAQVPVDPKRIACFYGPSYEKVFLLGMGDRVAAMSIAQTPWAHKLNPDLKKVAVMPSYDNPDVERILEMGIDLVFYWPMPGQMRKMAMAGITAVSPYYGGPGPVSREEFMGQYKREIRFYGDVLGEKARKIADSYCDEYDQKVKGVLAATSRIPVGARPKVYYITGRDAFSTQGADSLAYWLVDMAGGSLVSKDLGPGFAEASMEQIIAWNPDTIVISMRVSSPDAIYNDPRWKGIRAVKEKRVYVCPEGVFLWGHGSSEVHLFLMWLARIFHPDRFGDIDIETATKDYYARFYHYNLSTEEVKSILNPVRPRE